mmetsp:Transcript_48387/g.101088  ORF Transcript_48387/g.101088 Transcript_48387/m.101088 type:complete len:285 (-) Transcript_48387:1863-2717(-)
MDKDARPRTRDVQLGPVPRGRHIPNSGELRDDDPRGPAAARAALRPRRRADPHEARARRRQPRLHRRLRRGALRQPLLPLVRQLLLQQLVRLRPPRRGHVPRRPRPPRQRDPRHHPALPPRPARLPPLRPAQLLQEDPRRALRVHRPHVQRLLHHAHRRHDLLHHGGQPVPRRRAARVRRLHPGPLLHVPAHRRRDAAGWPRCGEPRGRLAQHGRRALRQQLHRHRRLDPAASQRRRAPGQLCEPYHAGCRTGEPGQNSQAEKSIGDPHPAGAAPCGSGQGLCR